jgi:DNA-directed RNA polymerase specialized sigma24 family protein
VHEKIEALTSAQALALVASPMAMNEWMVRSGVPDSRENWRAIWTRAEEAMEEWPGEAGRSGDVRRPDAERLREFVSRANRLPGRVRDVAVLLLEHGLSLSECAARLGISRETVRVHLRRLRAFERISSERERHMSVLLTSGSRRS